MIPLNAVSQKQACVRIRDASAAGRERLANVHANRLRVLCLVAAVVAAAAAVTVLIGWTVQAEHIKRIGTGMVAMNPATAVCFLLCAASLLLLRSDSAGRPWDLLGRALAVVATVIGAIRLCEYVLGLPGTVDAILFASQVQSDPLGVNCMAPNTAMGFIICGVALLMMDVKTAGEHRPAQFLALAAGMLSLFALVGYGFGVRTFYGIGHYIAMALHTALCFLALSLGLLCARPDRGLMALATGHGAGGVTLRRMLPAVIVLPAVLGWLRLAGERAGLYDSDFGVALTVVALMTILGALASMTARAVERTTQERDRALAALRQSEQRFALAMRGASDGLWDWDLETNQIYFSPAWKRMLGYEDHELVNSLDTPRDLLHPEDCDRAFSFVDEFVAGGGDRFEMDVRLRHRDGHYVDILSRGFVVRRSEDGSAVRIVGTHQDISQQRRQEKALSEAREIADAANKAKSEFLATMSHELRTPLNGVIGMTELLLGTELNSQQRRYAWLAKSSGDALLALINDILDFSKIEAGRLELESTEFDLRYAVESVAAAFASRAERKGLELVAGVHPDVPSLVHGDPGRFQQILNNLTNNAIKFTDQGEIVIRGTLESQTDQDATVRFTVTDTGIGVPPDRMGRLFESFSQVDASTTRKYGGSGLGLAICKRLVDLMGGQIGVLSEPGKGSTFWFTVTLEKQVSPSGQPRTILADLRDLRVLAVDDNATNREILCEQLSCWQIEHASAAGGPEAVAVLREAVQSGRPFGLAILDMHMPGMDGLQLAQAIKADPALRDTILLLLTSLQSSHDEVLLRSKGFSGWLAKPVRQSQLLDAITEAVAVAVAPVPKERAAVELAELAGVRAATFGARILLAEDHEISQEVATGVLQRAGYSCDLAVDGQAALEAVLAREYDLVLMDCQMPRLDGLSATRAIREAEAAGRLYGSQGSGTRVRNRRLPIIALTANATNDAQQRCLDAGMDDYISKPLNPEKLVGLIESHLTAARETTEGGLLGANHAGQADPTPDRASPAMVPASAEGQIVFTEPERSEAPEPGPAPQTVPPAGSTRAGSDASGSIGAGSEGADPGASQPHRAGSARGQVGGERPAFDLVQLRKQWRGQESFAHQLIGKFLKQAGQELAKIGQSLAVGDAEQVRLLAHSLKGAAAYACASGIQGAAGRLEALAQRNDLDGAGRCFSNLQEEIQRCLAASPVAVLEPAETP